MGQWSVRTEDRDDVHDLLSDLYRASDCNKPELTRANAPAIAELLTNQVLHDNNLLPLTGICLMFIRLRLGTFLPLTLLRVTVLRLRIELFDTRRHATPSKREKQVLGEIKSVTTLISRKGKSACV